MWLGAPRECQICLGRAPFDVLQDHPDSGASPRVLNGVRSCQYRMASYDEEHGGPDFTPAYGMQLHDPWLLEYVGAPESARLFSRSPEYWLHHLGHEKTLFGHASTSTCRWSHPLERAGVAAVCHGSQRDAIGGHADRIRSEAVSRRMRCNRWCRHTRFVGWPLHGSYGLVESTYYSGNPGSPAVSDMQCLHVVQ